MSAKSKEIALFLLASLAGWVIYRRQQDGAFTLDAFDIRAALDELTAGATGQFFAELGGGGVTLGGWKTPAAGLKYEADFVYASQQYQIPAGLLSRMAYQESRYNPRAISPAGAAGIMQLMPVHWSEVDPYNERAAILYAAKYMQGHFRKFGSWDKALAAYNWGQGNLAKLLAVNPSGWLAAVPRETSNYVTQIGKDTGLLYYGTKEQGVA